MFAPLTVAPRRSLRDESVLGALGQLVSGLRLIWDRRAVLPTDAPACPVSDPDSDFVADVESDSDGSSLSWLVPICSDSGGSAASLWAPSPPAAAPSSL